MNVSAGGVPKRPVLSAMVGPLGLEGDGHGNMKLHGGATRAVCLYSLERIEALKREGHPIFPGALGENLTVKGIDWDLVVPGDSFTIGDVELEVTKWTAPCSTTARFVRGDMRRIRADDSPGWSRVYARVLRGGQVGQGMVVVHRPAAGLPKA